MTNQNTASTENEVHEGDTLNPIPNEKRIMGSMSYLMAWLGGCVSIGNFSLGSNLVKQGLNLTQAIVAITIGSGLVCICLVINDKFCYKTGIPYVVQLRSAFGFKGTFVPALCRAIPAIVWYGFQSWVGASAINEVCKILFSFDNIWACFIIFHLLQVGLSTFGFKGIKWLENIGGVIIIVSLVYMLYMILSLHGDQISAQLVHSEGTWGLPFWAATTAFLGVNCAVLLNVGDYVRELKLGAGPAKRGVIYGFALIPATIFMGVIGLMVTNVTHIANPIVGFAQIVPNKTVVVFTLIFIVFAQVTTNLLNNALPPIYAFMDVFKLKYKLSAIVVGLLAFGTFPWELIKDSSAAGLGIFILLYSAFLGPVFAILATDYYIIRKQNVNVDDLYKSEGMYSGVNWASIIALIFGAAAALSFQSISWFVGVFVASLVYYFAMQMEIFNKKTA